MKKVININFQGRVVPIEESAYDILKQYVESLRRFFANEEGREEIINDIEDRIAELFTESLKKGNSCITDEEVNTIIASMGRPEDFEAEETSVKSQLSGDGAGGTAGGSTDQNASAEIPRGRLCRDASDKILGGVCGGLANYLRIDSSLVRILFAVITFGGFGAGVLLYILMWIILPSRPLERNVVRKRLFRNPEDKVISGVAGGLATYFNIAVWIPRLIFALPLVLGIFTSILRNAFWHFDPFPSVVFGSFGGTLLIVYIILWIVIPEARTASEKLEMKGEKVDLNTIRNTIQEDLGGFKSRAEKWGKEVGAKASEWGKEFGETMGQQGARIGNEFSHIPKKTGNRFLQMLGVLIKAFFLVLAGVLAFALFTAIVFGSIKGFDFVPLKDYMLEGEMQHFLVWPTILLFIFLPVLGLIIWIIRRVMKVKSGKHHLGWIFGGLWVIGLFCAIALGAGIGGNFSKQVSEKYSETTIQPSVNTLHVKMGAEPGKYYPYTVFDEDHNDEIFMLTKDEDSMLLKRVVVEVAKSDDSLFHAYIVKIARGRSLTQAEENMQKIDFKIDQLDSILLLQKGFAITKESKFRDQRVAVIIEVPVGKQIILDHGLDWYDWFREDFGRGRYNNNLAYDKPTHSISLGRMYIMRSNGIERVNRTDEKTEEHDEVQPKSKEELRREIEDQKKEIERKEKELNKPDSTYRYKPAAARDDATDDAGDDANDTKPQAKINTKPATSFYPGKNLMMMRFGS